MRETISIPVKTIGPVKITGPEVNAEIHVPLATYESPMWPSTNRGASVSRRCDGVHCTILDDRMTRSILLEGENAASLKNVVNDLDRRRKELEAVVSSTSRFCKLLNWNVQIVGNLLYLRLEAQTGDASGHNMLTKAADAVINWLLNEYPQLKYVSISGNICTDKKVSAINGLLGRGKYVVAEMLISRAVCSERLKTTPEAIVLAWLMRHPANITPVLGSTNIERIKSSHKALDVHLSREHWYKLFEAARGLEMP